MHIQVALHRTLSMLKIPHIKRNICKDPQQPFCLPLRTTVPVSKIQRESLKLLELK